MFVRKTFIFVQMLMGICLFAKCSDSLRSKKQQVDPLFLTFESKSY